MTLAKQYSVFDKDRRLTVSDGTPIAYTVLGGGSRTPVVFLNGWTCSDGYWAGVGPGVIAAGHRGVFLDTRGHGESGLPRPPGPAARNLADEDVSVARVAADVLEVLNDAGIEKAALAGHSMGVQVLFEAYRQAPERVAALIPIAGTYENPVKSFADLSVLDRVYPVADVLLRYLPLELLRPVISRAASPAVGHRVIRLIGAAGPKVTREAVAPHMHQVGDVNFSVLLRMLSGMRAHSTADLLPTVTAPTLVLAGRRDVFTPPSVQQHMADVIPGSEIVWFEEAGHLLPIEEPEGVVAAIVDFLARRVTGAASGGGRRRAGGEAGGPRGASGAGGPRGASGAGGTQPTI